MNLNTEIIFQIIGWIVGVWLFISRMDKQIEVLSYKIDDLRKKQEKYNNLQERMGCVEQSTRSAHHRLDDMTGVKK